MGLALNTYKAHVSLPCNTSAFVDPRDATLIEGLNGGANPPASGAFEVAVMEGSLLKLVDVAQLAAECYLKS